MRGLHRLILSMNKMTVVAKQDSVVCWKGTVFLILSDFYLERNQT